MAYLIRGAKAAVQCLTIEMEIYGLPHSWCKVDSQPFNQIRVTVLSAPHTKPGALTFEPAHEIFSTARSQN